MRKSVRILNDTVVAESFPVETSPYIIHFGDGSTYATRNWKGNALCLTGDGHRSQTLNNLQVTCKVCIEKLKAQGVEVNEVPYTPKVKTPSEQSRAWDMIRLHIRGES